MTNLRRKVEPLNQVHRSMNYLETLKGEIVTLLSSGTWTVIEENFERVGLEWRDDLNPGAGKPKYVGKVLADLTDQDIVSLGERCLTAFPGFECLGLQNAIWWLEAGGTSEISEVTRINLADSFDGLVLHPEFSNPSNFLRQFASTVLGEFLSLEYGEKSCLFISAAPPIDLTPWLGLGARVERAREPYCHRTLLDNFGFRQWPDKRIFQFLEALVHPTVRRDTEQAEWVASVNSFIAADGFKLEECDRISGHPVFRVQRTDRGVRGTPKNLIFASNGLKPELGFRDAINCDIVILKNEEHCLVYDDRISDAGLLWDELVAWWAKHQPSDFDGIKARRSLGQRLLSSLASRPEELLFESYFRRYSALLGSKLPALIPQVYLHYDPVTIRELHARNEGKRFLTQRMDFLILLPERVRVVIEVDGQQHYAEDLRGGMRPSPQRYAETVKADRNLRLAGYEVYRFSGYELNEKDRAARTTTEFFDTLFLRHGVFEA